MKIRLELEQAYDRALRDKRLERYQGLFHLSKCIPRYWRGERPTRQDILQFRNEFHNWYFSDDAGGGMSLTSAQPAPFAVDPAASDDPVALPAAHYTLLIGRDQ